MALKNFKFGFGDGYQEVALPEEHILQVIEGNESEKITDVKAAVLKALREPINSKPLQQCVNKGEKVAIVVSDITRTKISALLWLRAPTVRRPTKKTLSSAGRRLWTALKFTSTAARIPNVCMSAIPRAACPYGLTNT